MLRRVVASIGGLLLLVTAVFGQATPEKVVEMLYVSVGAMAGWGVAWLLARLDTGGTPLRWKEISPLSAVGGSVAGVLWGWRHDAYLPFAGLGGLGAGFGFGLILSLINYGLKGPLRRGEPTPAAEESTSTCSASPVDP